MGFLSQETIDLLVMGAIIVGVIYIVLSMMGFSISDLVLGMRATRRVKVDEEPRDQAERWLTNHRKSSKSNKPKNLKILMMRGDHDHPPVRIGKIIGLEAHQEGYLVFVKVTPWSWSKAFIIVRDLVHDANGIYLWVNARTFSTNGLYRWAVPPHGHKLSPMKAEERSQNLFTALFEFQTETDLKEDGAWAKQSSMMPPSKERILKAEVESPYMKEKAFYPEEGQS